MERTDLDQWRGREVARLLALVETQRRYYQEIVASVPVGLLVLSSDFNIVLANGVARKVFGLQAGESPRRMDTILPASLLDRIEEVLKTSVPQIGVMVETGRDKRRLRVGILAIRNWDEEAAQEALLAVEDLTGLAVFEAPAPPAREVAPPEVVAAPAPIVAEPQAPEVAAIEAVSAIEELPAISAQQLIANIDAVVWAVELPAMNFVFASPQAEKLLGFAPEHWTSHPSFWMDRVRDSDREWVSKSYLRAIETGEAHSCEFQAITANGSSVWLREYARLLPAADDQPRYMV